MYQWRKYIAVALSGLTLLACRGDDVVEIPESVYQVRIESSGITLPRGGSAVIPFRITEGALPAGGSIELSLRNGAVPAEFRLDGEKVFGTFGAVGSGANHEYEWIAGTGILRALPSGTTIIFR